VARAVQKLPDMRSAGVHVLLVGAALLSGCAYRWEKDAPGGDATNAAVLETQPGAAAPSFAQVRAQVLGSRCIVCHQASSPQNAGILLDTYEGAKAHLGDIERTVFTDKSMPKGGARLSGAELRVLRAWIRAGGPLNAPGAVTPPTPTPPPPANTAPEQFRWPRVQAVVFQKSCASCHQYDLAAAREGADAIIQRVVVKKNMPPAPDSLSEEQLEALVQWIRYGMPE
jgi:mono/diheme cytochrome c family protein